MGGSYVLEEQFTSAGGVNNGFPYTWQMKILGNWSTVGTNPGDHELLGFNSTDWQIDTDFVFDGTNTVFSAHAIDGYTLGNNIDLDFQLYGAAVPLPPPSGSSALASWAWWDGGDSGRVNQYFLSATTKAGSAMALPFLFRTYSA